MRLLAKIFFSVMAVFCVAFMATGYLLLSHSLDVSVQREVEFALRQYQFDKFSVQADLIANEASFQNLMASENQTPELFLSEICSSLEEPACLLDADGNVLYSGSESFNDLPFDTLATNSTQYHVVHEGDSCYILVGGQIALTDLTLDFVTKTDISEVIEQQTLLQKYFRTCLLLALAAALVLVLVITGFLTRPLRKMADAADRIADGSYHERLKIRQKGEVGELADSFNRMAGAVEEKVTELKNEVQSKEDFVANFAHELKTPMTSVIGYADMLYQKELPRSEVKNAAFYIWNEGMRLESMALKMMDLTVLNHQEIPLVDVPADEFLNDAVSGLDMTLSAEGIELICEAEPAYIQIDYDLMKTVLLNIIDNAKKADAGRILLEGKLLREDSEGEKYSEHKQLGAKWSNGAQTENERVGEKQEEIKSPEELDLSGNQKQAKQQDAMVQTADQSKAMIQAAEQSKAMIQTADQSKTMMQTVEQSDAEEQTAELYDKRYVIMVSDNGKGIPAGELSRITEAFYMVDKSRSRKQHGAGLGLSLVSRIVELHHGELQIESTLGEGTCVKVFLPAATSEEGIL